MVNIAETDDNSWELLLSALKEKYGVEALNAMIAPESAANDKELYQLLSNKFGIEGLNVLKG